MVTGMHSKRAVTDGFLEEAMLEKSLVLSRQGDVRAERALSGVHVLSRPEGGERGGGGGRGGC